MRGDAHAGFGGQAGETHREQSRHGRAPRPDPTKERYRDERYLARYDPATIEHLGFAA